ncbi:MAG: alcohol dehydrogenase catalytic domain-containing protein [Pseudomonadota bacterium]|nr:alcohol dehydrogenase catalytic domain-containing protein [Pseudomonadota bacterium]
MQALVYTGPNQIEMQERPYPELHDGEVILRIESVGICGSDMHAWRGHDPRRKPGLVLGHEFVGTVAESAAAGVAVGRRFTGNPLITCGVCEYCVQGRNNLCANRTMVGMTRPGAFAQFMSLPATSLIEMPQALAVRSAALTEPAATALHALNLSMSVLARPLPECAVLVIGGGAIGMLAALLLRDYGVRRLQVAETNPLRRDSLAAHAGCTAFDPRTETSGESTYDYVMDAVGSEATRKLALHAVKPGGVVMHAGLQDGPSSIDMRKLTLAEITLLGTYTYTTGDLRATVAALAQGRFGALGWVEERSLGEGPAAFDDLDQGRSAAAKILLRP